MTEPNILVVDDDRNLLELLSIRLGAAGYEPVACDNDACAIKAVQNGAPDLAIVDLQLENTDGITLMQLIQAECPDLPVIILTAHGSIESAVDAMKKGAFNYLTKPFDPKELLIQIERAIENRRIKTELKRLKDLIGKQEEFSNIIAKSEEMRRVLNKVSAIAKTDSTVYIQGESGTGKELIAKAIHMASSRKERPFVAVNCAAIPEGLIESEMFGHEKGSFTGAVRNSKGLFMQAHEGTIFLDEIGDMPMLTQAKLLRVLQERKFYPVGSEKAQEVDLRVVVATNKNLEEEVKSARFREDLFYRIHVIPVHLPPLRERKEDIPLIAQHFVESFSSQMKKNIASLTPKALHKLLNHDWPGNVRELENTIEYAVAMAQDRIIDADLILSTRSFSSDNLQPSTLKQARDKFESEYLTQLMLFTSGNVSRAADLSGRYRADLYGLLKKHNINPETFKKSC
ncbi:MAG: sigma-54-dependent Fis family transcriptional regulator [Nitrospirae bacterium]|nr:sigma-54-dependent Fis family transcriptional regulator [Nitrospirota bacterium]